MPTRHKIQFDVYTLYIDGDFYLIMQEMHANSLYVYGNIYV